VKISRKAIHYNVQRYRKGIFTGDNICLMLSAAHYLGEHPADVIKDSANIR
jgi:hypothetical protein